MKALALVVGVLAAAVALHCWRAADRRPVRLPELRDALNAGDGRDLAAIHEKVYPGDRCALCHVTLDPEPVLASPIAVPRWLSRAAAPAAAGERARTPSSALCQSCHDGSLAAADGGSQAGSHPVDVDYQAALRSKKAGLRQAAAGMRLDDGKVGCVSCHVGHRGALALGPAATLGGSCETCHAY